MINSSRENNPTFTESDNLNNTSQAAKIEAELNAAKKAAYGRQPYFCPYARERIAKQKQEKLKK